MWLKVISVVFSFFIWLYVVSTAEIEKDKTISLSYIVPDGFSLADEYPKEVTLNVKGPRLLVRKYLQEENQFNIELLQDFRTGKNKFSYNLNQILPLPAFGVELLSLSPKNLELKIEKTLFKRVPITINIPADIKNNATLDGFKVTPSDIEISGPASKVKLVSEVKTESLEDLDFSSGDKKEIELIRPSNLVGLSITSTELSYTINSSVSEFTFKQIPIIFQSTKLIASADKRFVDLTLRGVKKTLENLNAKDLQVIASVQKNSRGAQNIELYVNLPLGLELVSVVPDQVKITLE